MAEHQDTSVLPGNRPILSWFDGAYERCFIALHPFFVIPGLDPARCQHGPVISLFSDIPTGVPFLEWIQAHTEAVLEDKELDSEAVEEAAKLYGTPIDWHQVCREAGFASHLELHLALLSSIHALNAGYHSQSLVDRLNDYCAANKIFPPTASEFQVLMSSAVCAVLTADGETHYVMSDEFRQAEETVSIEYLKECGITPTSTAPKSYAPVSVSSKNERLVITVEHDCLFTLIFERDKLLPRETIERLFEGFWCGEDTTLGWWHDSQQPLIERQATTAL